MPQVDVTSPLITGLNAASGAIGGVAQGYIQGRALEMSQQARLDDAEYKTQLVRARNRELAMRARDYQKQREQEDRALDLRQREQQYREDQDLGIEEAGKYVADKIRSNLGAGTVDALEKMLDEQYASATEYASTLSPRARAVVMAGVEDDAKRERAALAQRAAKASWEKVIQHPLLSQDKSPMGQELLALAQEHMMALEQGAVSPAQSMQDHDALVKQVTEHRSKQRNWESGLAWAQNEMSDGRGDTEVMNDLLTAFENEGPGADFKSFKRDFLKAKHGVELDTVKLGKVEIPRGIRVGSQEWRDIAEQAADDEVTTRLGDDLWMKENIDKISLEDYLKIRERNRKGIMRGYAAKSGATRGMMRAMGLLDDPATVEANALSEIEKALKAAGIDPNMKVPSQAAPSKRPDVQRRTPQQDGRLKVFDEPEQREPVQPGRQRVSSSGVNEGDLFDEQDIEDVYRDG